MWLRQELPVHRNRTRFFCMVACTGLNMNRQRAQRLRAALFVPVVVASRRAIDPPLNSPMRFALLVGTLFSFVTLCRFDA